MSNVQECIDLYLTDEEVTDAQFRAVIVDAHARDLVERARVVCPKGDECALNNGARHCLACGRNWPPDETWERNPWKALLHLANIVDKIGETVEEQGRSQVLLNRVDTVRRDQFEAMRREFDRLTGFCDSLTGRVRVLRERLDNLEGK